MELSFILKQKTDINQKILDIYNNEEVQRILNSCSSSFRHNLPRDDIESLKLISIWLSIKKWKKESQFITFLYTIFKNELIDNVQPKFKSRTYWSGSYEDDPLMPEIIHERLIERLSFKEIGKKYSKSQEWARKQYNKELRLLKKEYSGQTKS